MSPRGGWCSGARPVSNGASVNPVVLPSAQETSLHLRGELTRLAVGSKLSQSYCCIACGVLLGPADARPAAAEAAPVQNGNSASLGLARPFAEHDDPHTPPKSFRDQVTQSVYQSPVACGRADSPCLPTGRVTCPTLAAAHTQARREARGDFRRTWPRDAGENASASAGSDAAATTASCEKLGAILWSR